MINNNERFLFIYKARLLFTVGKNDFIKVNKNYATNTDLKTITFNHQNNKVKRSHIHKHNNYCK